MNYIAQIFILSFISIAFLPELAPGWETRVDWPDDYPRPPKSAKSLFFIQRNINTNTIVYDLDLKEDGTIDANHPLDAYWLRYGSNGERTELTWLQSILAFGYSEKWIKEEKGYHIKLKAYNERHILLRQESDTWKAIMTINGKPCYLSNIYVYADESGIFPKVIHVDIYGVNVATGESIKERILNE